ncbi:phasin family protein [Ramlibacter sp.]|uniref:phasin family protein n=1 Tax=Ramlibacter sp. TaxID=1917967 RepID=UPI003D0B2033
MVKKLKPGGSDGSSGDRGGTPLAGTIKDSASQIWLAGLGAFAKAQEEGGKVFEALVKEGMSLQRKTQSAAEEKIGEATARMTGMATELSSRASGQWDKLEGIFEERVGRALKSLGVPASADLEALVARIEALERAAGKASARATRSRGPAVKAAKPARKRAAPARKSA